MKRWMLAPCLMLIPALGVLAPAAARASTVAVTQLTSGKPVKVIIATSGQKVTYSFAAKANKHVTFQVTKFNFSDGGNPGGFYLNFYKPAAKSAYSSNYFGDNGFFDFTPPVSGTWTVKVVPYSSSVGSMVLTFANDVATQALTSGTPVTTTIKFQGQHAGYSFAATANKHVTFQVTQFNFSAGTNPGGFYLDFYKPGSTSSYAENYFGDNGFYDFTPPLTGTWTVVLTPYSSSVGSMVLTFANDVATQALPKGTAVNTTIAFQGQHAGYSFTATANGTRTFTVTNFNFTDSGNPGGFYLDFYEPGNASSYGECYFGDNGSCDLTTPLSGTWTVTLTPYSSSVGSMTLKMT